MPKKTASTPMLDTKGYIAWEDVLRLVEAARDNTRNYLIIRTLAMTGRRLGEVMAMRPMDIHKNRNFITFTLLKKSAHTELATPVPEDLKRELLEYCRLHQLRPIKPIFHITPRRVQQIVREVGRRLDMERVGEKWIHPHHFRHSFAVHLVEKKINIRKIQMLLGHSNVAMTTHYLQFSMEDIGIDIELLFK